jgi:hypothetical protein
MDFWSTLSVLLRRWYVVLPAFLATIGGTAAVYTSTPDVYVSHSVLVLTTPRTGPSLPANAERKPDLTNPLLNFDHGLSTSASILIQKLGAAETVATLGADPAGTTRYKVSNGSSNPELLTSGPFLFIEGESETGAEARQIVRRVAEQAEIALAAQQQALQAPPSTFITMDEVVPPTTPVAEGGNRARPVAAALGVGLAASVFAAYAAESIAVARRRRKGLAAHVAAEPVGAQP